MALPTRFRVRSTPDLLTLFAGKCMELGRCYFRQYLIRRHRVIWIIVVNCKIEGFNIIWRLLFILLVDILCLMLITTITYRYKKKKNCIFRLKICLMLAIF